MITINDIINKINESHNVVLTGIGSNDASHIQIAIGLNQSNLSDVCWLYMIIATLSLYIGIRTFVDSPKFNRLVLIGSFVSFTSILMSEIIRYSDCFKCLSSNIIMLFSVMLFSATYVIGVGTAYRIGKGISND